MTLAHVQNNLNLWNSFLREATPEEIITWALDLAKRPMLSTSFGNHSASLVHACAHQKPDILTVWCDTGYNTPQTYRFARQLIQKYQLNMAIYTPKQTTAYRDAIMGIPSIEDPAHEVFTEQVKLEPFRRALAEIQPDVWFTNIRESQTQFRAGQDILSISKEGILKVSPFYYWSDSKLATYLTVHELPNESRYFDPTKALDSRECGLHLKL